MKIGLLPLYTKIYDDTIPEMRPRVEKFNKIITNVLKKLGFDVFNAPICRLKDEFKAAIKTFENKEVEAIITLHLAYSPSLESVDALSQTKIPVIVLDTTPSYSFGPEQNPEERLYNHGIHGVQDMCCLLLRNGKAFKIVAGHWEKSDVMDRLIKNLRGAKIASAMMRSCVGLIGESFKGMGDFYVPKNILEEKLDMRITHGTAKEISKLLPKEDDKELISEISLDKKRFEMSFSDADLYVTSLKAGIALRRWIKKKNLTAIAMNILEFTKNGGLPTIPFLEVSKAMTAGIGYAGEGDVLTSTLVGALLSVYQETTFVEMFCPNWKDNSIFINHMGEANIDLFVGKPKLVKSDLLFTDVSIPIIAAGRFKPGRAIFVNLAPIREDFYTLIVTPVEILDMKVKELMENTIRGWLRPLIPINDFLEIFSKYGGTHHSALVYGDVIDEIVSFGELMKWNIVKI